MDLFSLFKFLRCSPFDDLRVFNAQVTENWKARSDPESIAKLKILVNCLSLRRPKDTIALKPRKDETRYLTFDEREWKEYQRAKARVKTLTSIDDIRSGSQENASTKFLNALKWVNELRLICNHGVRTPKEMQKVEQHTLGWSAQDAQTRFDQIDGVGLAKCSNSACCQDLSSVLASEAGSEHGEEPVISESLDIWCSPCSEEHKRRVINAYRICNHLPRRSSMVASADDRIANSKGISLSSPSYPAAPIKNDSPLPTKVKQLVQDLLKSPDDIKR